MTHVSSRKPGRPSDPQLRALRRRQILDAAARVFAQRGYSLTDLEIVAEQVGVSKGTIYRYFRSKRALFLAAVDEGMNQLREAIDVVRHSTADPLETIERVVRVYLQFFRDHPHVVELLVQERAQFKDRKKPTYFEHRERNLGPWRDLVRDLIAAGRLRDVPVERVLNVIGDLLYGTMFTNYFARREATVDEQCRDLLDILRNGILSDREREQRDKS